ncbi:hypothetical protein [Methylocystis sp. B8]|uniref:hypothetical protein n=1 Tax=Methylocystis sp. B8 TaxID=544938 RepID=UPI0010FDFA9A|nr:hypothetical protein [Methylocystis sp. B8]TLG75170.1 hypothetical protein FEV16_11720 [Methylocystis sp. B8]
MKKQECNEWRSALDREVQEQSAAALENVGTELQFKLAKIVGEPLPAEVHDLLNALEKKLDRD